MAGIELAYTLGVTPDGELIVMPGEDLTPIQARQMARVVRAAQQALDAFVPLPLPRRHVG